jgi:hypothetical protein
MVNPVAVYQSQSVCAIEIPNDVTKHARLVLYNLLVASRADVKQSAYSQAMHSFYFCMLLVGGPAPNPL